MAPDKKTLLDIHFLRNEILGNSYKFKTPFGERFLTYADYIASGRTLRFIENYMLSIQEAYANTHTEDDVTGKSTTELLHMAERIIKRAVNGNDSTRIIATGTGATGAIKKLQEILGVYIPPATKQALKGYFQDRAKDEPIANDGKGLFGFDENVYHRFLKNRPVVFIGPYEHHSNEITWRESLAEVVTIGLDADSGIDIADLEKKVSDVKYANRMKIGSFSAASNVTGILTPVYDVARIMHKYDGIVCYDFAASAPYVKIDMNRDPERYFDAIYFSPHKFLGGPGASGLLIFNERLYSKNLPPTFGGGGTVDYVGPHTQDYSQDIEVRENSGTPGTLQTMKAAMALEIKEHVGVETIERIEREYTAAALERFGAHENIEVLGNPDPNRRISVISFNIKHQGRILHHKLVTRLLNDLFGIQSRAGCSCAGPYGHTLLNIGYDLSERYRTLICHGFNGLKPGWVRIGFHFTHSKADFAFICAAVEFIAEHGHRFLPYYHFDVKSGSWSHGDDVRGESLRFGLREALATGEKHFGEDVDREREKAYKHYLDQAASLAEEYSSLEPGYKDLPAELEALSFFHVQNYS